MQRVTITGISRFAQGLHPAGLCVALLFFTWSLTPSLLPRMWYFQALATGISLATGYGIGILGVRIWRWSGIRWRPSPKLRRIGWWVLAAVTAVVVPLFTVLGAQWQQGIRRIIGVEQDSRGFYVLVLLLAMLIAVALILLGRGIGGVLRRSTDLGRRFLPTPVARLGTLALTVVLLWMLIDGVLIRGLLATAERAYAPADRGTREGIERPSEPERSGSPASGEEWDTLGRDGRSFVASGPRAAGISAVTDRAAIEPIRVYAGVASAESLEAVADRALAELHRTGAFERENLLVVTTTGRGWVNTAGAESLEYLSGGDSAIVAIQYSYLQSPFAYIADRGLPLEAGRVLLEKVYGHWVTLPENTRPKLLVMGESLGSYGAQGAVGSEQDMVNDIDGGLLIGTPNFAQPWGRLSRERDPGSLERLPVVDQGRHIRFASRPADLELPAAGWERPRFVFWQHAGDPITWWSFDLLLRRPDWLAEPLGPDVHPQMRWVPFVTFWQVSADMALSVGVPPGFGHNYGAQAVDLWAGILDPAELTPEELDRIRVVLSGPEQELEPLGEIY